MSKTIALILGILAGIIGLVIGLYVLLVGGIFEAIFNNPLLAYLALGVILASIIGIIATILTIFIPRIAGILMILAGISGFLCLNFIYLPSLVLFSIGGIMALVSKKTTRKHKK